MRDEAHDSGPCRGGIGGTDCGRKEWQIQTVLLAAARLQQEL